MDALIRPARDRAAGSARPVMLASVDANHVGSRLYDELNSLDWTLSLGPAFSERRIGPREPRTRLAGLGCPRQTMETLIATPFDGVADHGHVALFPRLSRANRCLSITS